MPLFLMRYSSQRQEKFANRGRISITKLSYSSGWVEYTIESPTRKQMAPSKKQAEEEAKRMAVQEGYAFNPLFDYSEKAGGW